MKLLNVKIRGLTNGDFVVALEEIRRKVEEGYTSGGDQNDTGRYYFEVKEEERGAL